MDFPPFLLNRRRDLLGKVCVKIKCTDDLPEKLDVEVEGGSSFSVEYL